jgi:hypothetical protein
MTRLRRNDLANASMTMTQVMARSAVIEA